MTTLSTGVWARLTCLRTDFDSYDIAFRPH